MVVALNFLITCFLLGSLPAESIGSKSTSESDEDLENQPFKRRKIGTFKTHDTATTSGIRKVSLLTDIVHVLMVRHPS